MRKLFFFLGLSLNLYGQINPYIPDIEPRTPESNSIIKNIELPSGSYTGIFGYTIDLGKIDIKGIDFPISLKYSTTGLKVNSISSNVGAGWNLDLGGVSLSRDVRGYFDEVTQELSIDKKYIDFNPNEENPLTLGSDSDYRKGIFLAGITPGDPSNKPVLDAEKDYFIYSLLGNSGRFIEDSTGYFHTIPKDDIKIINKNKIIDNSGNIYYFKEYNNATNQTYYMDSESDNVSRLVNGYNIRLDSIKSFSNETIKFKYESDRYEYTSSYDKKIKIRRNLHNLFSCKDFQNIPFVSRTHQNIRDYVITEITYPNGRILFNYETNNLEVTNKKILKGVKFYHNDLLVKDYLVNSSIVSTKDNSKIIEISGKEKFNKKLFLFSVTDKLNKFNYEFDYYNLDKNTLTTTFPARFSGEEDYWGNFKLGSDFIPSSKEYTNAQGVVTSFKGANKKPVLEHSVIGSIKSIKLPTGGYQEVKYELDNHFDPNNIDIIENSHNFSVELSYTEILQGKTSSFTIEYNNQLEGKVINPRMYFYYEGINSVNFDELSQSLPTVEHYYADVYINDVRYKRFYGSEAVYLQNSIQKGDVIKVIFGYVKDRMNKNENKLTNISPILYFSFQTKYYKSNPKNVDLGNLRIKELTLKENATSNSYKKEYKYNDFSNESKSSGLYIGKSMDNDYLETTSYNMSDQIPLSKYDFCEYIIVSSKNNFNLYALENKSVVYPNVREKIVNVENNDSNVIDRVYSVPSNVSYSEYELPYIAGPYYGYLGGRLLNEIYKDLNNKTVKKVINNYTFDNYFNKKSSKYNSDYPGFIYPAISVSLRNVYYELVLDAYSPIYYFNVNIYHYPNTWVKLTSTEEEVFFENNSIKNKTEYIYNYNHIKPIKETIINSKGENIITEYQYPQDIPTYPNMDKLISQNRIGEPVITKQKVGDFYVASVYNEYNVFNEIVNKSRIFKVKGRETFTENDVVITYDSYDNYGNITQYTPENGIPVSIIWGYNGQYPILKVEGVKIGDIPQDLIDYIKHPSDWGANNTELSVRLNYQRNEPYFKDAMVTGYVYKPLVGVTEIIQPNGETEFYEYDSANRLKSIKNNHGEIIKTFEYNYANTESEINEVINYYNEEISYTVYKQCGSNQTTEPITYTIPAGRYSSTISVSDANTIARNSEQQAAQDYANSIGVCKNIYYNEEISYTVYKQCGSNQTTEPITYTIPAGRYSSTVSVSDANNIARNSEQQASQDYANNIGVCKNIYYNEEISYTVYKQCGSNQTTEPITYTIPAGKYSSLVSVSDANTIARNSEQQAGQDYANNVGVCKNIYYNENLSLTVFKTCQGSQKSSALIYYIPAGRYSSTISVSDANNIARNSEQQASRDYAEEYGVCENIRQPLG